MKQNLIVRQDGSRDCGAAALLSVIRYYGGDVHLDKLVVDTKTTKEGTNFYNISEAALKFGLRAKCYKADDISMLKDLKGPIIAQMNNKNYKHFVVIYKIKETKLIIMDPAYGKKSVDIFDFSSMWTGYVMLFEKVGTVIHYRREKILNRIIRECLGNNIHLILVTLLLSLIFTCLSCIISLYAQIVFDKVIGTVINNLLVMTLVFSILLIIKNITDFIRIHLIIYLNQKLDVSIILSAYSKIILLPYNFYKNKTMGEVLSRIDDLSYVKNFIAKLIVSTFMDLFMFIFSFIIIYNVNNNLAFTFLLIDILYLIVVIIFRRVIKNNTLINQENNAQINSMIGESVNLYETIKGLSIEDEMIFRFNKLYTKALDYSFYSDKILNIVTFLKNMITDGGMLIISFLAFKFMMEKTLLVGDYMTITFLASYVVYPFRNILDLISEYHYIKNALERGNNLLEVMDDKIYDKEKLKVNGNIRIDNLKYSFNNKNYVLKGINLFMRDKERVLFIGKSGSGKSTILKILYKYYDVERGVININNYDLNDYSTSDIRKNVTYVSQNEMLFSGSIRDNILLGRRVSEVEFLNVCKIVHVDEIVLDKALGYDYLLLENGVNLSGGQRQRIILARSLLKDSKIIMIDEGLNQLDEKLEREILISVFNYFYDKTFIMVSHRNVNMDLYDRVIEINDGIVGKIEEVRY